MIRSLTIEGYRCFEHFEMRDLGRVNLLVGMNNRGKTALLEAIWLLSSQGDPDVMRELMLRRDELIVEDSLHGEELEICHLFRGHEIGIGSRLSITGNDGSSDQQVSYAIRPERKDDRPVDGAMQPYASGKLVLDIQNGSPRDICSPLRLSMRDGLFLSTIHQFRQAGSGSSGRPPVQFVGSESLSGEEVGSLWSAIVLTREEALITQSLQTIEPAIERIAFLHTTRDPHVRSSGPSGIVAGMRGSGQRVPLGSLGDGIWRMLALAIAGARSENGVLLVDEIDTGLHYTVMNDMWKMIRGIAERLNVQVFATTHSSDCVRSLASICRKEMVDGSEVTIQRIDAERKKAVSYFEHDIALTTEEGIEVR